MKVISPQSIGDLQEALLHDTVQIVGSGSRLDWVKPFSGTRISLAKFDKVLEYRPDDLAIRVECGARLGEINQVVKEDGLALPIQEGDSLVDRGTIGGLFSLGLPHLAIGRFGPLKNWVMGMRLMLADGRVIQVGSSVIKSVAGFDIHRTMVGSRGGLAGILDITLRLSPSQDHQDLPSTAFEWIACYRAEHLPKPDGSSHIDSRVNLTWSLAQPDFQKVQWAIGPKGALYQQQNSASLNLERKLKDYFDPAHRLAEGFVRV